MGDVYEKEHPKGSDLRTVLTVEPGSCAEEGGILPGDELIKINGKRVRDIFDYKYLSVDETVSLLMRSPDGEEYTVDIEKDPYEDLGITFVNPLMDIDRSCANRCVFCFIDQMPPGMRDTLYFKDDDIRLSFMAGNYVTLTNVSEAELKRIVKYHMSPLNVSVHAITPELRCELLKNRNAGNIIEKIKILTEGGITVNGQIVLVPGVNDGEELRKTLNALYDLGENVASVSAVPVGLTKYRDNLPKLRPYTSEESEEVVNIITEISQRAAKERGKYFAFASDEFYIKAGIKIPSYDEYDGFPQIENGVGMVALLGYEIDKFLSSREGKRTVLKSAEKYSGKKRKITIAVGMIAKDCIKEYSEIVREKASEAGMDIEIDVVPIVNKFFGETVTVSGLITAGDLINQLSGRDNGEELLITCNMLKANENIFLDDLTVEDVEKALSIKLRPVDDPGEDFVRAILG